MALVSDVQRWAVGPGSPVAAMDKIPRGPTRVGTRWREVVRLGPWARMTVWSEVTAVEADRMLAERFWGAGMRGTLAYIIRPDDGHTVLRQQEHLDAVGWLRPFGGLIARILAPRLHRRLLAVRDLLETAAP